MQFQEFKYQNNVALLLLELIWKDLFTVLQRITSRRRLEASLD